jgi:hypothetical protein
MRVSAADADQTLSEVLTVPDWLLAVLRFPWAPVTWGRRRLRRRYADRQALIREGSEIVSRLQQFTESLGPASIMLGSDDEHRVYLLGRHATWHNDLRAPLRTYANLHPSDQVWQLGRDVDSAVGSGLTATIYLLSMRNSQEAHNTYLESVQAHKAAVARALPAQSRRVWR